VDCGLIFKKYWGLLQSGGNKGIHRFNLQRESQWTVGGADTGFGSALPAHKNSVDRGGTDTGCGSALPAHSAQALGLARARRWGATGRGGHRELGGLLTGARAIVWWPGDGGEEQRWLKLIARAKEGMKGSGERGNGVVRSGGGARLL
jgi:hypothetical protein